MITEKRLNVRMEDQLLRQLKADAALRGITLSDLIRELAEGYILRGLPEERSVTPDKTTQEKGSTL